MSCIIIDTLKCPIVQCNIHQSVHVNITLNTLVFECRVQWAPQAQCVSPPPHCACDQGKVCLLLAISPCLTASQLEKEVCWPSSLPQSWRRKCLSSLLPQSLRRKRMFSSMPLTWRRDCFNFIHSLTVWGEGFFTFLTESQFEKEVFVFIAVSQ